MEKQPEQPTGRISTMREMVTRTVIAAIVLVAWGFGAAAAPGLYTVTDAPFNAQGDGSTDDTSAFTQAMAAAYGDGGGIVTVPAGRYRIAGTLIIPRFVTLEGVSPRYMSGDPLAGGGSVLLAESGEGNANGTPFIRMESSSTVKNVTIFYPNQTDTNPPKAYPWTIQGALSASESEAVIDVTIVNAYQAVDFGTNVVGRHWVEGLTAQAFYRGLYINQCTDVGRVNGCHFGLIWRDSGPAYEYMRGNGIAYLVGRTDGQQAYDMSAEGYSIAFYFFREYDGYSHGPGSGVLANAWTKDCGTAFLVQDVGDNAGWSFVDGHFEGLLTSTDLHKGQVKFYNCAFNQAPGADRHAVLRNRTSSPDPQKAFFFENCYFGPLTGADPVFIETDAYTAMVVGCTFDGTADDVKVQLGPNVNDAVIAMNHMGGGVNIVNNSTIVGQDFEVGLNSGGPGNLAANADLDGDGMLDVWEILNGLNPIRDDSEADYDGDGLTNKEEAGVAGNPWEVTSASLRVIIEPGGASSDGAQWRIDEGPWRDSGDITSGLDAGSHVVSFRSTDSWLAPADIIVALELGESATRTATYLSVEALPIGTGTVLLVLAVFLVCVVPHSRRVHFH